MKHIKVVSQPQSLRRPEKVCGEVRHPVSPPATNCTVANQKCEQIK